MKKDLTILKEYFDIDEENKTAHLLFNYDNLDDIYRTDVVTKKPMIKEEVLENIVTITNFLPFDYVATATIRIKDIKEEQIADVQQTFMQNMILKSDGASEHIKRKTNLAVILLLVGVVFLATSLIFLGLTSDSEAVSELVRDIVSEILDICAWVFVWEAVTVYFIERNSIKLKKENYKRRVKSIKIEKAEE